jgi:2-keto-3-deoxy-L-arabinonate dehydratase
MTSGMIVDQIKPVILSHLAGDIAGATEAYGRVAMAINHENRQCGWQSCKAAMVEGGVIKSEFCRHPIPPLHPAIRSRLIDLLRPIDPLVLKWGH